MFSKLKRIKSRRTSDYKGLEDRMNAKQNNNIRNIDKIRNMSDDELISFIERFTNGCVPDNTDGVSDMECDSQDCHTCKRKHRSIREYLLSTAD